MRRLTLAVMGIDASPLAPAVLLALTNAFITGSVLHVDGGVRWA